MSKPNNRLEGFLGSVFDNKTVKEQKEKVKKQERQTRSTINKEEIPYLIIALNYAINTIKNKPDVVDKKEDSTWFLYYQQWTKLRTKLQNKIK